MIRRITENEEEDEDDKVDKEEEFVKTLSDRTPTDDKDETYVESKEGTDAEITNVLQGNENLEIKHDQVIEDGHVTTFTAAKKTEILVTSSSHSSDLASKFLNFTDFPLGDAEIVSPMDVPVHHEVPSTQTHTLLIVHVSVITTIPQSLPSFTPPPQLSTPTPPPTTEATNPQYALPNFASTQSHKRGVHEPLSASITAKLAKQVKIQRPNILPKKVSNFASPVIQKMVTESLEHVVLSKESSQPQSSYEAAASLTKFELKKILINKMDKSK
ncbi:hypothetical protein Tco_1340236, partial [Tanacetum coccineum]